MPIMCQALLGLNNSSKYVHWSIGELSLYVGSIVFRTPTAELTAQHLHAIFTGKAQTGTGEVTQCNT